MGAKGSTTIQIVLPWRIVKELDLYIKEDLSKEFPEKGVISRTYAVRKIVHDWAFDRKVLRGER